MFKFAAFRFIFCLVLLSFTLQAASVIVGAPPQLGTGNCDPFGCPAFFGLGTYQQVYEGSVFPGPMEIQALTFFDVQVQNSGEPAGGIFTLSLSYTTASAGLLNLVNPANNISDGFQNFFTGGLPPPVDIGNGGREMTIDGAPFNYDPAHGNLLLTVAVSNPSDKAVPLYLDQALNMSETSNAYFGVFNGVPVSGGNDIGGLVTQFSYSPVTIIPEPSSMVLALAGAILIGCKYLRRRRT